MMKWFSECSDSHLFALVVMVLGLTGIVGMAAYHITKLFVPGSGS